MAKERVYIISAVPLSAKERKKIRAALILRLGEGYLFSYRVDKKLIGGVRVETPDTVYDASIQGKLSELRGLL